MSEHPPFRDADEYATGNTLSLRDFLCPDDRRAQFFPGPGPSWTDAMVARTRRHIGGCLTAIEMAFEVALDDAPLQGGGGRWPHGAAWRAVEARPALLSEGLIAHFRTRAAFSLMKAPGGQATFRSGDQIDGAAQAHLDGLALALSRWAASGEETTPLRADLPAEYMEELVWVVASSLARGVASPDVITNARTLAALNVAGQEMLAAHDEQAEPLGAAARIAHVFDGNDTTLSPIALVEQGHYLPLCAVIAARCGLDTADVAHLVVHHRDPELIRLICHAAGLDAVVAPLMLLALRPVRDCPSDAVLGQMASEASSVARDQADALLGRLRVAPGFRDALAHEEWAGQPGSWR